MKILFINHSCSRTGAPLVLLYFIQWLKEKHPEVQFDILSLGAGPLERDFDKLTTNHFKPFKKERLLIRILRFSLRKLKILKLNKNYIYNYQLTRYSKNNYDIIYQNTVVGLETSSEIKQLHNKSKLILHLHELEETITHFSPNFKNFKKTIDFVICASDKVRLNLIKKRDFFPDKCKTIYEFSNLGKYSQTPKTIDNHRIVVAGAGFVSFRKGVDLFLKTAKEIENLTEEFVFDFQWLGEFPAQERAYYKKLIKVLNFKNQVKFLGQLEDPLSFYNSIDLFLMTSREDPFPLVCIEAANSGVPIFCFDNATGTQEVINDLEYLVAPSFDTKELAKKVVFLIKEQSLYNNTSIEAIKRFSKFNIENQSEKIYKALVK